MIQFKDISLARGAKPLIEDASFQLHPGQKVGLTGANGTGKSSLFVLLRGELHQERGDLEMPAQWVIAHVTQETPALGQAALDFTLDGDVELRQVQIALAEAEAAHDGVRVAELHQRLGDIDGYAAQSRAATLLDGLGFIQTDFLRPVKDFSGGWRMRLNLARALMCRSDVLLLDEPTNHLDLDAVIWLEGWLRDYRGTLLLISHDRDFLDNVVDNVLHIERQHITFYRGGYSDFEQQRAERLALQQAMFEKQQRKVAHLQSYIDRFRVQATKARQAQSRIKALERMERVAAAHVDAPFSFSFKSPKALPDPLTVLDKVSVGYAEKPILRDITLTIRPNQRIGLLGKNGAGKSTLMKLLAAELKAGQGTRTDAKDLKIGYFAQHQVELLRLNESPLQHMQRLDQVTREQDHLDYLGGFDFRGDMAKKPCENFSGGEKSRLALAILIWRQPNFLLLDEPTNHLDLDMRDALSFALQDFTGGVIMVSHDRAMLRATCDRFLIVADGQVREFDGDLDDYKQWLIQQKVQQKDQLKTDVLEAKQDAPPRASSYAQNKADRQARIALRRPVIKAIEAAETQLAKLQSEKGVLDARAADNSLYEPQQRDELQALLKRQAVVSDEIEALEMQWLDLQSQLEALPLPD